MSDMLLIVGLVIVAAAVAALFLSKKNLVARVISITACALGAVVIVASCIASVPTGHTGVVTTFGKVENYTFEAGLHVKNPFSKVVNMDNRTQKGSLEMLCFSSDIQEVQVLYTVNYQIQKNNAQTLYRTIGNDYYNMVVTPCIQEAIKTVAAKYNAEDLISSRAQLAIEVEQNLAEKLKKYNIDVTSTAIENMDFTDAFTNAVEEKQVAAQNKLKAETEAQQKLIEAEAAAKALLIAAEAEAKANQTISNSLTADILYQQWLEKWNGQLPQVAGSDANVILEGLTGQNTNPAQ